MTSAPQALMALILALAWGTPGEPNLLAPESDEPAPPHNRRRKAG